MAKIDELWTTILDGVKDLAIDTVKGYVDQAKQDVQYFLDHSKAEIEDLAKAFADNEFDKDELADLLNDQLAIAEMFALTKAGIAKIRIDRFRVGLMDLIVDSIFKIF